MQVLQSRAYIPGQAEQSRIVDQVMQKIGSSHALVRSMMTAMLAYGGIQSTIYPGDPVPKLCFRNVEFPAQVRMNIHQVMSGLHEAVRQKLFEELTQFKSGIVVLNAIRAAQRYHMEDMFRFDPTGLNCLRQLLGHAALPPRITQAIAILQLHWNIGITMDRIHYLPPEDGRYPIVTAKNAFRALHRVGDNKDPRLTAHDLEQLPGYPFLSQAAQHIQDLGYATHWTEFTRALPRKPPAPLPEPHFVAPNASQKPEDSANGHGSSVLSHYRHKLQVAESQRGSGGEQPHGASAVVARTRPDALHNQPMYTRAKGSLPAGSLFTLDQVKEVMRAWGCEYLGSKGNHFIFSGPNGRQCETTSWNGDMFPRSHVAETITRLVS